ncbi:hypothetical protein [Flavobacterium lindanitolerans]|uniref:hypothetical protein n=1 Tax=Flavobacterium lindanitolerans TaxID=428988 RepID=UPI002809A7FD|nr:hypothetical protein [Flavobacterium lindanitolerans]MDQ7959858.1 hypothetical protein [Flavobacterium lindanitolerans]
MSHEYKSRLTDYLSSDPTKKTEADNNNGITNFEENYSGVKNLCFVQLDDKCIFLNYNYLVAGEFFPEDNKIVLHFTTHVITLNGQNLESLYQDIFHHLAKIIKASNDRYASIARTNCPIVNGIDISQ